MTLHLLDAALTTTHNNNGSSNSNNTLGSDVALCGALVRFLNLVSQLGERRSGSTRFAESAAIMGVPEWLVRAVKGFFLSVNNRLMIKNINRLVLVKSQSIICPTKLFSIHFRLILACATTRSG